MNEHEFLKKLETRAIEQKQLIDRMPTPTMFYTLGFWLGDHPWRILIPVAVLLTLLFRQTFGDRYIDIILWIFGGL